jgi:transposase
MYVRTNTRKNKDGSIVEYIQLAHNRRHPKKKYSVAEVIYTFGRRDQLDVEAIKRLIKSLSRFICPEDATELQANVSGLQDLKFLTSRPAGGALILRDLWNQLKINECLQSALKERAFSTPVEEALFALVANRALAPSSKLAIEKWAKDHVYLGNDTELQVQHLYRSMDFLLDYQDEIQERVFWSTANLLNLTVDLIFFDTTNTYFEIDDPGPSELKAWTKSKQKRDDLPHVTVGLAVTRDGIPVRCWVLPGNQHDSKCVEQVQQELNNWKLGRVVWAMDRGMTSEDNKRILQKAGGHYILGEKLRGVTKNAKALNRGGRFKEIQDNLHIKEVYVGEGVGKERFVIAYNPEQATHDKKTRERILKKLGTELTAINSMPKDKQTKAKVLLKAHSSMGRYVKELKNGNLKIDKAKVRNEEKLDGKYLLSTSDESLSAEDIALGYKQLYEVERAFRTLKSTLALRPVYHSKDNRIRSHVMLCWLALMFVRIAESKTGLTWPKILSEMERFHIGEFVHQKSRILRYTELNNKQRNILKKLKIKPPRMFKKIEIPS